MDITFLFAIVILIFSVIIHELAHGYVAYSLGDPTAKYAGRLTLNPIAHIDLFGSIILPLFMALLPGGIIFGWAKPVPINPYNFKDQKWGNLKVAIAGPLSNFTLALIFGIAMRFMPIGLPIYMFFAQVVIINLMLGVFNLLPIPPLDGHWILFTFIPDQYAAFKQSLQQYGMYILIALLFFGALSWLGDIVFYLFRLITGQ